MDRTFSAAQRISAPPGPMTAPLVGFADLVTMAAIALVCGAGYYALGIRLPADSMLIDFWFQSDTPRVLNNMTERFHVEGDQFSTHYRTKVHPLFSLIGWGGPFLLRRLFGLATYQSVVAFDAMVAGLLAGAFYVLLRLIRLRVPDALLFTVLMATNAAALAWLSVPETFPLGALGIVVALIFVAVIQRRRLHPAWTVAVSVLTFAATITNWMAGLTATALRHVPLERRLLTQGPSALVRALLPAAKVTAAAAAVIMGLWIVQRLLFPTAPPFVYWQEETNYLFRPEAGGPLAVLRSFLFHTVIFPVHQFGDVGRDYQILVFQMSGIGSASAWGKVAAALWTALLALGAVTAWRDRGNTKLRIALATLIGGQLALHLVYGEETFLYAIHFMPLLVCVAAYGATSRLRPAVLLAAALFVATAGINNAQQYVVLRDLVLQQGTR